MKTNFSVLLAALAGSALIVSASAQGTSGSTGTSATSATTTSSAATPTTTTGLPAASTTTLPAATTTTLPAATTTQLPTTSTGILPATESALPNPANDTNANRATVSSDATALNPANGTTTTTTTTTTGSSQVSPGTTPLGPTDVGQFPISGTTNTIRGAADSTTTTTTTGALSTAAGTKLLTRIAVATPPPSPKREIVSPSPGADQTWVPGHYTYVQGQWIWISGKWSTPPTTSARWLEGTYDPATKLWTEGHWDFGPSAVR